MESLSLNPESEVATLNDGETRTKEQNEEENQCSEYQETDNDDRLILLNTKRKWRVHSSDDNNDNNHWARPYWLGCGLFLILSSFWLLDSLKESILSKLVFKGDIHHHLPIAKLFSVATTLLLVVFLEYVGNARKLLTSQQSLAGEESMEKDNILSGGGTWEKMSVVTGPDRNSKEVTDEDQVDAPVPASMFVYLGVSYSLVFMFIVYVLEFHYRNDSEKKVSYSEINNDLLMFKHDDLNDDENPTTSASLWNIFAYFIFAMIESFGSLTVATFWSYTNSTLTLREAEHYYGIIIAIGQFGAICGSTIVARGLPTKSVIVVAALVILLIVIVMTSYDRRYRLSSLMKVAANNRNKEIKSAITRTMIEEDSETMFFSGFRLILKYNYVLYILGVSCLYEVNLTTLDYQMKLLGYSRFDNSEVASSGNFDTGLTFSQFVGRFGQLTNVSSLLMSSIIFPFLMRRLGLRLSLRIFPTLLLIATMVAYMAVPANLGVLFVSVSLLKAMTYSIHDPSKELLYIPTCNRIKFQSKFWIDVMGARLAKAVGSGINKAAGTVDRSILLGSVPSILSALALLTVCWKVGNMFDKLVTEGIILGNSENIFLQEKYQRLNTFDNEDIGDDSTEENKPNSNNLEQELIIL